VDISNQGLMQGVMQGEKAALEQVIRLYGDSLLGYLTQLTGNRETAEDYFQQTFCKVCEKSNTFRGPNLRAWLFKIATNVAMDGFRKQKREPMLEKFEMDDCPGQSTIDYAQAKMESQPLETIQKEERKLMVQQLIDQLPSGQRTILVLSYYQQLSYSEVAEVMNCSIGTVKAQMFRALKKLAEKLPDKELI
jgi:RNA polymerase sigma-70 factor (ECF subfamily)